MYIYKYLWEKLEMVGRESYRIIFIDMDMVQYLRNYKIR